MASPCRAWQPGACAGGCVIAWVIDVGVDPVARGRRIGSWSSPHTGVRRSRGGVAIPELSTLVLALGVLFFATVIHAVLGFGTALIAMPLLTLLLGLPTAAPVVAHSMVTTIAALLWDTRAHIDLAAAWQLLLASALGIPLGLWLVEAAPAYPVRVLLGLVLIAFSTYNLARPALPALGGRGWVVPFGLAAGILGGAYNTSAPPVVLYGALKRWSPERIRGTVQGYFLPAGLLICLGHAIAGLWTLRVFKLYATALPLILLGIALGLRIGRRIPPARFERVLYASLIGLGALLFV